VLAIIGSEKSRDPEVDVFRRTWTSDVDKCHYDHFGIGSWQRLVVVLGLAEAFILAVYEFVDGLE
jgi:hypothetical protein